MKGTRRYPPLSLFLSFSGFNHGECSLYIRIIWHFFSDISQSILKYLIRIQNILILLVLNSDFCSNSIKFLDWFQRKISISIPQHLFLPSFLHHFFSFFLLPFFLREDERKRKRRNSFSQKEVNQSNFRFLSFEARKGEQEEREKEWKRKEGSESYCSCRWWVWGEKVRRKGKGRAEKRRGRNMRIKKWWSINIVEWGKEFFFPDVWHFILPLSLIFPFSPVFIFLSFLISFSLPLRISFFKPEM